MGMVEQEFEYRIRTAIAFGAGKGYRERSAVEREKFIQEQVENGSAALSGKGVAVGSLSYGQLGNVIAHAILEWELRDDSRDASPLSRAEFVAAAVKNAAGQ